MFLHDSAAVFSAAFLSPEILRHESNGLHAYIVRVVLMSIFTYIHYCSVCVNVAI
jgi:hypothetical protein